MVVAVMARRSVLAGEPWHDLREAFYKRVGCVRCSFQRTKSGNFHPLFGKRTDPNRYRTSPMILTLPSILTRPGPPARQIILPPTFNPPSSPPSSSSRAPRRPRLTSHLLAADADPNAMNHEGYTPLHFGHLNPQSNGTPARSRGGPGEAEQRRVDTVLFRRVFGEVESPAGVPQPRRRSGFWKWRDLRQLQVVLFLQLHPHQACPYCENRWRRTPRPGTYRGWSGRCSTRTRDWNTSGCGRLIGSGSWERRSRGGSEKRL